LSNKISLEEYRSLVESKVNPKNKFNVSDPADRTWTGNFNGDLQKIVFHSKKEMNRWVELLIMARSGEIFGLARQIKYNIGNDPITNYIADFEYSYARTGGRVIEDVKGFRTQEYKRKKRLFEKKYGIEVTEI
jgi:hypothetical protein